MSTHNTEFQKRLQQLQNNSGEAKSALIELSCKRLRSLASKMFKQFPNLKRWNDSSDLLQGAVIRLYKALSTVKPETPQQFYGLAALQIRRELLDLTKKKFGPEEIGRNYYSDSGDIVLNSGMSEDPLNLLEWGVFHSSVESLPEHLKEVVDAIWYNGLSKTEASEMLQISLATVKRRWTQARLILADNLKEWKDYES